jgi:hypothetical protein
MLKILVSVCERIMIVLSTDVHFCKIFHLPAVMYLQCFIYDMGKSCTYTFLKHQYFQFLKCLATFLLKPFIWQLKIEGWK